MTTGEHPVDSDGTRWTFDDAFLGSAWRCRWGDGCVGIADTRTPELGHGCCTYGAELLDDDEAMRISALAATIEPELFAHRAEASTDGVLATERSPAGRPHTRTLDGACIFFNPVGFPGGVGCALHLAAEAAIATGEPESLLEWKPSVCWQLPLKVEREGTDAHLRAWQRSDWGPGGDTMAWCCTEPAADPSCFDAAEPVIDALATEIQALVGTDVYVSLRRRLVDQAPGSERTPPPGPTEH